VYHKCRFLIGGNVSELQKRKPKESRNDYLYLLETTYSFVVSILDYAVTSETFIMTYNLSMALQPFVGSCSLFQFSNPIHSRQDSLDGGSARRQASTYTQNNTKTEQMHTDIHASRGIRTHDFSDLAVEDGSWLRPHSHRDRHPI
jgi:hypothetical protein